MGTLAVGTKTLHGGTLAFFLKEDLNASKPSGHLLSQVERVSKRLGGNVGRRDKNTSWGNGFPNVKEHTQVSSGQVYMITTLQKNRLIKHRKYLKAPHVWERNKRNQKKGGVFEQNKRGFL